MHEEHMQRPRKTMMKIKVRARPLEVIVPLPRRICAAKRARLLQHWIPKERAPRISRRGGTNTSTHAERRWPMRDTVRRQMHWHTVRQHVIPNTAAQ